MEKGLRKRLIWRETFWTAIMGFATITAMASCSLPFVALIVLDSWWKILALPACLVPLIFGALQEYAGHRSQEIFFKGLLG